MPITNNSLAIFRYVGQDVRTVTRDGQTWFVAADVLAILDVDRTALRRLDDDEKGVDSIHTLGGPQHVAIVNEPGLYALVLGSRKAEAKQFKRWVTHEVIPEIRQTGSFSSVRAQRALPQDFASALREFAAEIEAHEETKAALDVAQPRADAWDAIASAEGDYSVGDAAKILARAGIPTGPTRLFGQLADLKWTYRGGDGAWRSYAERVEKGYLAEKPSFHYHPKSGERVVDPPQVRVTVRGIDRLRQRLHVGALKAVAS